MFIPSSVLTAGVDEGGREEMLTPNAGVGEGDRKELLIPSSVTDGVGEKSSVEGAVGKY